MYSRILVPVDGSPASSEGLREAIRLAAGSQARLRLMHVIDELSFAFAVESYAGYGDDWLGELRAGGTRIVEGAKAIVEASDVDIEVDAVLHDSFSGVVHELVAAEARTWMAELVVIGTHGRRGIVRPQLGRNAEQVVHHSPVPVLLVPPPRSERRPVEHVEALAQLYVPMGAGSLL